ncbi:MAG: DHA2 family efflux MFS transporter permease subunit [Janthinobacterium lividum]
MKPSEAAARRAETKHEDRIDPLVWKISAVVMLGPLMTTLDATVVNVSLSALGRELHTSLTTIQWVTSAYLLSLALMLPLSGWLVDRIGAKRVYLMCFAVFTVTSLLCGVATSAGSLIAFRVLQGAAGGLLAPMAQMMVARVAGRHMARVMGISVMPVMIGPILGPAVAGVILQHWGWPWIFFINLPIGLFATTVAWRILPRDTDQTRPRKFDLVGFMLLPPALVMLLHSLDRLGSNASNPRLSLLELVAAGVLLAAFIWHGRRRGSAALIDLGLFANRTFRTCASTQFLSNCLLFGGQMLMPLYLLMVGAKSPASAGLLLASTGLGLLCIVPLLGTLTDRFVARWVASSGALLALLATLPFALGGDLMLSPVALCVGLFVRGAGVGCINIPSMSVAYASIDKRNIAVATTAINIVQRLGGPVVTTALAIYLHYGLTQQPLNMPRAFTATFWLLCFVHLLSFLSALRLPLRARHRDLSAPAEASVAIESLAD